MNRAKEWPAGPAVFDRREDDRASAPGETADREALVRAAQAGDQEAIATLLARYAPLLRAAVGRRRGMPPDGFGVEDRWQEAYLAFLELLREYRPTGCSSFGTYLRAKLAWRVRNRLRDGRLWAAMVPLATEELPPVDSPEEAVLERVWLAGLLADLPRRQREVIGRIHWLGQGTEEVAAAMGISPQAVGRLRRRAVQALRRGAQIS